MAIVFDEATKEDIDELIRLRIEYMIDDFGSVSDHERECMEKQLPDYFSRKLGTELIAFVARDGERIVATVYLLTIEMPSSPKFLNGLNGEIFSVYTEKEYRRRGIGSQLLKNLIAYAKEKRLCRLDLSATSEGYPVYKKLGFVEKAQDYTDMRMKL